MLSPTSAHSRPGFRASGLVRARGSLLPLLLLAGLAAVSGCKGTTPIKDILDDPNRFEGKVVRVAGEVRTAAGVLGYGVYRVDDGTGVLPVVTKLSGAPREGARVAVEGKVQSAFTLGSESATVLIEDRRATP